MGQSPPGSTYIDKPKGLPFFQGKADFREYFPTVRVWCTQPIKIAEEGDILISVRAPVGHVNMNNLKCCIGRGLSAIRCKDNAINWFIFWYLHFIEAQIASLGSGSTFGAITRDDLISLQIPLPPIEEQKRIAAKTQELMQEVKYARTACEKQLESAKALPSAYLRAVFESEEAKKWERKRLGEVCEINPSRPKNFYRSPETLTSFVPMVAVDEKTGTISKQEVVPYSKVAKGYTYFEENDVLFAKITPCMQNGKHVIARNLIDSIGFGTTEFHVLRPNNNGILPQWIHFFVRQPYFLLEAMAYFTGAVGQQRVPESFLSNYIIPFPPIEEQKRITAELKEKMADVERILKSIEKQLEAINALPQVILRKAFRGEL